MINNSKGSFSSGSDLIHHHDGGSSLIFGGVLPSLSSSSLSSVESREKPFGDSVMICMTGQCSSNSSKSLQIPFFLADMNDAAGESLSYSTSGFVLKSNKEENTYFIITSGTLLSPFISNISKQSEEGNIVEIIPKLNCKVTITLPNGDMLFNEILPSQVKRFGKVPNLKLSHNSVNSFVKSDIQLMGLFSHTSTDKYIHQMTNQLQGWYWGHPLVRKGNQNIGHALKSSFKDPHSKFDDQQMPTSSVEIPSSPITPSSMAVFKIKNCESLKNYSVSIPDVEYNGDFLSQGDDLFIVSSPFGLLSPHSLSNHLTKGIICNKINNNSNSQNLAIITDCQIHPGSEGAPVFAKVITQTKCVGFCTLPVRSISSTNGLNIVISIDPFMKLLREKFIGTSPNIILPVLDKSTDIYNIARNKIALIIINNTWATGILLTHTGYILTNSHVMAPFMQQKEDGTFSLPDHISIVVQLDYDLRDNERSHKFHKADLVLYCSSGPVSFNSINSIIYTPKLDVALLKIHESSTCQLVQSSLIETSGVLPCSNNVREGEDVYVVGFPLMQPINTSRSIKQCTITKGIVSKVVNVGNKKAMICTTAHVHDGNSGGGVFNAQGQLIGLVTSNVKYKLTDRSSGHVQPLLIPSINFSIPIDQLEPLLIRVLNNEKCDNIKNELNSIYNSPNQILKEIYSFKPISPLPTLPQRNIQNTNRSGNNRSHTTSKL